MTTPGIHSEAQLAAAYREHASAVYGLAARICGPALAGKVTQEVFVGLWRRPERFDPTRGPLRSFLLAVARGRAVDVLRAETSRRRREQGSTSSRGFAEPEAEARLVEQERSARISRAIAELPGPERDAIVSAFYGERSYREAALVLGVAEGTIKSRIRSGLVKLRSALGDLSWVADDKAA